MTLRLGPIHITVSLTPPVSAKRYERALIRIKDEYGYDSRADIEEGLDDDAHWLARRLNEDEMRTGDDPLQFPSPFHDLRNA